MDQTSGTTPAAAPPVAPDSSQPAGPEAAGASAGAPGFGARGRVRRRARFLRKARELAYRDLGGLVFSLHRFGQRNDALVLNKLNTLEHIDAELRTLETALGERDTVTVLREAGITACPRCAAIHSGDDRYCPNCGLSMSRHVDLPIAGAPSAAAATPVAQPAPQTPPSPPATAPAAPRDPVPRAAATAEWTAPSAPSEKPAPASPPDSGASTRGGLGRSPKPPSGRPEAPTATPPPRSSEEVEQTEVLHPVEPEE